MMENIQRREWLKRGSLLVAGLSIAGRMFAREGVAPISENNTDLSFIKISSNENPYGPSPMARKAMAEAAASSNRYPWQVTDKLRQKIASLYNLDDKHVLMGAGSSEILGNTAMLAGIKKGNAVSPHPTFRLWWSAAENYGLTIKKVPLTEDKKINTEALLNAIDSETRLLYICNPNNPTGTVIPVPELKRCIEQASERVMVLLDEAYTEYSDEPSMAPLVANIKNLVIAKTFSKIYGMAGARAGFALAHPDTIQQLSKFQPWANAGVSAVSLAGAMASLDDKDFVKLSRTNNDKVKQYAVQNFESLKMRVIPSNTNFLYYQVNSFKGSFPDAINSESLSAVRIFEETGNWYRTSIGTMDEMKVFFDTVRTKLA